MTSDQQIFYSTLENKPIGYANDSTLIAVVQSLGVRVAIMESLTHDAAFRTAGTLFPLQYHYETIMLTLYLMVRDLQVLRARPMLFLLSLAAHSLFVFHFLVLHC